MKVIEKYLTMNAVIKPNNRLYKIYRKLEGIK